MSPFEFVISLHAIVLALAIANVLIALGDTLKYRNRLQLSWLHGGWCVFFLFGTLSLMFAIWEIETANPSTTIFEVLPAFQWTVFVYIATRLLNPDLATGDVKDLDTYFMEIRRPFFICTVTPSIVFHVIAVATVGTSYANVPAAVATAGIVALGVAGYVTRSVRTQKVLLVLFFALQAFQEANQAGLTAA